ncbi:MAG TPA: hypothetical protein VF740_01350, partial [Candidatus Acidoferrum sp.]
MAVTGAAVMAQAMPAVILAVEVLRAIPLVTRWGIRWATFLDIAPVDAARGLKRTPSATVLPPHVLCKWLIVGHGERYS